MRGSMGLNMPESAAATFFILIQMNVISHKVILHCFLFQSVRVPIPTRKNVQTGQRMTNVPKILHGCSKTAAGLVRKVRFILRSDSCGKDQRGIEARNGIFFTRH